MLANANQYGWNWYGLTVFPRKYFGFLSFGKPKTIVLY